MPALAVWTPEDGLLGALAPLGLAAAAPGPVLVLDLDRQGPRYPGEGSLASLVSEGPRLRDLNPVRKGMAVLRNGGVTAVDAARVIEALLEGWAHVVLRLPPRTVPAVPAPVVPVRLLVPGGWFPPPDGPAVFQVTAASRRMPGPGIRLPVPSRSTVAALLRGRTPIPIDRWVRAWRRVWEMPWKR